jgi:hypothetical protein
MTRLAVRTVANDTAALPSNNHDTLAASFARHLRASDPSPASTKNLPRPVARHVVTGEGPTQRGRAIDVARPRAGVRGIQPGAVAREESP